ncbi:MAG: glycosyltransferase family 4 protein [Bacteroidaceae bacterium]|nr:glycosyltransferase family 4 protein [Bacteroidaceae bacterium]
MKILFLSYSFEPDLGACAFRNSHLFHELMNQLGKEDFVHVVSTVPNRYSSFSMDVPYLEEGNNYMITRLSIPKHGNGMKGQVKAFVSYYRGVRRIVGKEKYDLVYATSAKLFTAYLGRKMSYRIGCPLYLDIRDLFVDNIGDIFANRKVAGRILVRLMSRIERYTFSKATHINLISEGFKPYFDKYPVPEYSFYSNGIDDIFIESGNFKTENRTKPYVITYAGNIGTGQSLDKVIPEAALQLGDDYLFRIIGDGGTLPVLKDRLKELNVQNVQLIAPVKREEIIKYYLDSDFLFLQLNDLDCFKKVLPSKIFEYGAFDKPIIAGVAGFARQFLQENVPNHILYNPNDAQGLVDGLKNYSLKYEQRDAFRNKFKREFMDRAMADSIIKVASKGKSL